VNGNGSRPSVLILLENIPVRGDHRVWPECLALRDAGYEIAVICPSEPSENGVVERHEGIEIHGFPHRPAQSGTGAYLREYGSAFWHVSRLVRRLGRYRRFDVVQACNPPDALLLAALPLKRRGTRFVFDQHDLVPELLQARFGAKPLLYRTALALERLTYALADVVISTNDSYRRIAMRRGRKRPEDVFVVRNGPDLTRFKPNPDPELKRARPHLIAFVGEMGPQDGVDHAIRALGLLGKRRRDWYAVFAGDGPSLEEAQHLARELGIEDLVDFPGFVDDQTVMRIISTADVCLAPEPKNAFNDASTMIKIAEYLALSRPVVAYDLTESRYTAGEAAAYAEPNVVESFAGNVDELLNDPDRRARMGELGRARVEKALSWADSKRALLAAYDRALGRG
jgi:glycosyltransferase involved in cell wall biosynthesis